MRHHSARATDTGITSNFRVELIGWLERKTRALLNLATGASCITTCRLGVNRSFGNKTPLLRFHSFCSFYSASHERGGAALESIVHQWVRMRAAVARINVLRVVD